MIRQRWFCIGPLRLYRLIDLPIQSTEAERRAEEARRNASRRATWFTVSHTRKMMAEIDKALAGVFPKPPSLLDAFDEMRRWS